MSHLDEPTAPPDDPGGSRRPRRGGLLGLLALPWIRTTLRWAIAIFGIYYVVSNISLHDRVMIANPPPRWAFASFAIPSAAPTLPLPARVMIPTPADGWPTSVRLAAPADEKDATFRVVDPVTREVRTVDRAELLAKADPVRVEVRGEN